MTSRALRLSAVLIAALLVSCGGEDGSSPGTVVCDGPDKALKTLESGEEVEVVVRDEIERLQREIDAAEEAGDEDTAAMLRSEQMSVGGCDPELTEQYLESIGQPDLLPGS